MTTGERPIEGWKTIAAYIGRSIRKTRKLAWTGADKLPVRFYLGEVIAWPTALDDWKDRHTLPLHIAARLHEIDGDTGSRARPREFVETRKTRTMAGKKPGKTMPDVDRDDDD